MTEWGTYEILHDKLVKFTPSVQTRARNYYKYTPQTTIDLYSNTCRITLQSHKIDTQSQNLPKNHKTPRYCYVDGRGTRTNTREMPSVT